MLTPGSPSGARCNARCSVVSDQVAVRSASRSGARWNARRMRARSAGPYCTGAPPPWRRSSAARPSRLKRATTWATASCVRRPAVRAAAVNVAPAATASSTRARAARSTRSLPARAVRSNPLRSPAVSGRRGSFCRRAIIRLRGRSVHRSTRPRVAFMQSQRPPQATH